jgi:hypothetical protein
MPKKVTSDEIDGWGKGGKIYKIIKQGETLRFKVVSDAIYEVFEGEEDLLGNTAHFDNAQTMVYDLDEEEEKCLTVQRSLGKLLKIKMEEEGLDYEKDFKDTTWKVRRYDERSWDVKLMGKVTDEASQSKVDSSSSVDFESIITKILGEGASVEMNELISRVVLFSKGQIKKDDARERIESYLSEGILRKTEKGIKLEA